MEMDVRKDVDKLDALFHENSMFVHMGGSWGKQPELDVIRTETYITSMRRYMM